MYTFDDKINFDNPGCLDSSEKDVLLRRSIARVADTVKAVKKAKKLVNVNTKDNIKDKRTKLL